MKTTVTLPDGYREIFSVDLQNDKKLALIVNGLALAIMALMAAGMHFIVPVTTLFLPIDSSVSTWIRPLTIIAAMVAYIILHEAVHGIAMKLYGCTGVRFGFTGAYAFAACDDYIAKKPYVVIALAPIVVWGVVLAALNFLVPTEWFWVVYIIQIFNISGAAGDLYVTLRFRKMPDDILVRDNGVNMKVYSAQQ